MTAELKYFGFYKELGFTSDGPIESLRAAASQNVQPDLPNVLQYLSEGWICVESFDSEETDVLAPGSAPIGPMRILTDGEWVWPNVIAHYVDKHGVQVPAEFVSRMRANGWHVPPLSGVEFDAVVDAIVGERTDQSEGFAEVIDELWKNEPGR